MSRSSFKGPFTNPNISKKIKNDSIKKILKVRSKSIIILPEYVDKTFYIYTGKKWSLNVISKYMVGYTLGSFVFTRKFNKYKKK